MKKIKIVLLTALISITASMGITADTSDKSAPGPDIKKIRIGISQHYPPLNFNSGSKGVEITMARELASFLGAEPVLIPLNVEDYVQAIEEKRVDIVIAGLSRTLSRGKKIWFSTPYLTITPGVLARRSALPQTSFGDQFEQPPIKTLWDLKRVHRFEFAVKKGSVYQEILSDHFAKMPVKIINENDEGLNLLKKGTVSGFIHDSLYLQYIYERDIDLRRNYLLLQGGDYHENICVGLPKGDISLKIEVDLFIDEAMRLGRIQQWIREYN